jgi:D-glycero-D-manno-heptose 1,7-bisphosphate phosphatase
MANLIANRPLNFMPNKAVFLDRDGVLIHDVGAITSADQLRLIDKVPEALWMLKRRGYLLILATNQAVVARGMISEAGLKEVHHSLELKLKDHGGPALDAIYFCPHHPNADLSAFRLDCACRKPKPGMLVQAALDFGIELGRSLMVGDRLSDVLAGQRAGCGTFLVETGQHLAPPIVGAGELSEVRPDHVERDLFGVARHVSQS